MKTKTKCMDNSITMYRQQIKKKTKTKCMDNSITMYRQQHRQVGRQVTLYYDIFQRNKSWQTSFESVSKRVYSGISSYLEPCSVPLQHSTTRYFTKDVSYSHTIKTKTKCMDNSITMYRQQHRQVGRQVTLYYDIFQRNKSWQTSFESVSKRVYSGISSYLEPCSVPLQHSTRRYLTKDVSYEESDVPRQTRLSTLGASLPIHINMMHKWQQGPLYLQLTICKYFCFHLEHH